MFFETVPYSHKNKRRSTGIEGTIVFHLLQDLFNRWSSARISGFFF